MISLTGKPIICLSIAAALLMTPIGISAVRAEADGSGDAAGARYDNYVEKMRAKSGAGHQSNPEARQLGVSTTIMSDVPDRSVRQPIERLDPTSLYGPDAMQHKRGR